MRRYTATIVAMVAITTHAEWRYQENTDLMDDSKFVLALSPQMESSTPADHNPKATLRVGCYPPDDPEHWRVVCAKGACGATPGYLLRPSLWATYLNLTGDYGRVRFDDEEPVVMEALADPGHDIARLGLVTARPDDDIARVLTARFARLPAARPLSLRDPRCELRLGSCDAWSFVSRLLSADQVLVELPQYGTDPIFKFPVGDEGRKAIRKVINTCDTAETAARPLWGREGSLTLLNERMVKRPKKSWRKHWSQRGDTGRDAKFLDDYPPLLNAKTGLVVVPYMEGDRIISIELNGEEFTLSFPSPWGFKVPVTEMLSGPVEITYSARTKGMSYIYGQYERQYRLSFGAVEAR